MFNLRSSKTPFHTRFYYGWIIIGIAMLTLFFSGPGQTYSISIFINEYIREFGWSRTFVSSIYSAATIVSGSLLFLVGRQVDRLGGRKMAVFIGIMFGLVCLFNSLVATPVMLFLGFFLARYFGQGSMVLVPSTVVPQWFVKRRAVAFSIMSLGAVAGSAFIPPLNSWLIQTYNWQTAWRFWGILVWVVFVPVVFFLLRDYPEQVGLLPDNKAVDLSKTADETLAIAEEQLERESFTLKQALRTRSFWLMLFCLAVPSMVNTGLIFHMISILGDKGISTTNAAYVLSVMALVMFPSTFIAGFILDRIKVRYVVAGAFITQLIAMFLLLKAQSLGLALAFGVLRGFTQGLDSVSGNVLWPNYYGRKYLGSIRGAVVTGLVIASALGPLPIGIAYDLFGGYQEVILFMMLFPALGIVAALLAKKPHKPTAPPIPAASGGQPDRA